MMHMYTKNMSEGECMVCPTEEHELKPTEKSGLDRSSKTIPCIVQWLSSRVLLLILICISSMLSAWRQCEYPGREADG